jgi:hypothetical protein
MGTRISTILSNIAAVNVTVNGVTATAMALSTLPDTLRSASFPLRLILLDGTARSGGGDGIVKLTLGGSLQQAVWTVRDIYILRPVAQGSGLDDAIPALTNYVAAYAQAFATARTIAENCVIETITAEIAVWEYPEGSGTKYHIVEHGLSIRETF